MICRKLKYSSLFSLRLSFYDTLSLLSILTNLPECCLHTLIYRNGKVPLDINPASTVKYYESYDINIMFKYYGIQYDNLYEIVENNINQ